MILLRNARPEFPILTPKKNKQFFRIQECSICHSLIEVEVWCVFVGVVACNYRMIFAYVSLRFRIYMDKFHWIAIASKDIETHRKSAVFIIWPFAEETGGTASWQKSIIRP